MKRLLVAMAFIAVSSPAFAQYTTTMSGTVPSPLQLGGIGVNGPICVNSGAVTLSAGQGMLLPCNSSGQLVTSGGGGGGGGAITAAAGAFALGSLAVGAGADGWNVTQGTKADTAWSSGSGSIVALLKNHAASLSTIASNTSAAIPAGTATIGNMGQVYPAGSTPITASATGTTAATTATLAANASLHTYICGMSIRANAAAAATADSTITGTVTGTLHFTQWTAPNASGLGITEQIFQPCVISSAVNTGIAVISAAPGTSGVVSVSAWGYQL